MKHNTGNRSHHGKAELSCRVLSQLFQGFLTGLFFLAVMLGAPVVAADEQKALALFEQGEAAWAKEHWSRAKALYEAAVAEHGLDGSVTVNPQVTRTLKPGPGLRVSTIVQGQQANYFPNRRLVEIQVHELDVKARALLAFKALNPPDLKISYALLQDDGDKRLMAGETVRLAVDVFNQGESAADGVELTVKINALDFTQSRHWASIDSEGRVSAEWSLGVPRNFEGNEIVLDVRAQEKDGYSPGMLLANLSVMAWQAPTLQIAALSPTTVRAGRRSLQSFEVRNMGQVPARDVRVQVTAPDSEMAVFGYEKPVGLGLLEPGGVARMDIEVLPKISLSEGDALALGIELWSGDSSIISESLQLTATQQVQPDDMLLAGMATPIASAGQLGDIALPVGFPEGRRRARDFAVLIGNRDYQNLPVSMAVSYALNDRRIMQSLLQRTLGVPEENFLPGTENMTAAQMQLLLGRGSLPGTLDDLIRGSGGADTVYVYYSGHGMPDAQRHANAYLLPVDASPADAARIGYPLEELYVQLGKLPARRIVVMLDACFSGRSDTLMAGEYGQSLVGGTSAVLLARKLPLAQDERFLVYTASGADELANWLPVNRHGLFTSFLVKGLAGEADDGDRSLTAVELQRYLDRRVTSTALRYTPARRQHPQMTGNGDTVLVAYDEHDREK